MKPNLLLALLGLLCYVRTCAADCLNISISNQGSDSRGCLDPSSSRFHCKTLDYVVRNSESAECIQVNIYDNQTLNTTWIVSNISVFSMEGSSRDVTVSCLGQAGIEISEVETVVLSNLGFLNCGLSTVSTHTENLKLAAVAIYNSTNLTVTNCTFTDSTGTGLLVVDTRGPVSVSGSVFKNKNLGEYSTNGLSIQITNDDAFSMIQEFSVTDCLFEGNHHNGSENTLRNNIGLQYPMSESYGYMYTNNNLSTVSDGNGGGLTIKIENPNSHVIIMIANCQFNDNYGWIGGGAYINTNSFAKAILQMSDCKFTGNTAGLLGGGLYLGATDSSPHHPEQLKFSIDLNRLHFGNNSARHAGGMMYQTKGQSSFNVTVSSIQIKSCSFKDNVAKLSGAAIGLFKLKSNLEGSTILVNFHNCLVTNNSVYMFNLDKMNSTVIGNGIIYAIGISFTLNGSTLIAHNHGTGVLASAVNVYLWGNVVFANNKGSRGGAVALLDSSRMIIQRGLNLTFKRNHAELFGGAVYHMYPVMGVMSESWFCVFSYYQDEVTDPSQWEVNILFINNTCTVSGSSVFLSSPGNCHKNEDGEIFTENKTFHFVPSYFGQVSTSPVQLSFASPSINCSSSKCQTELMLGEKMTLTLTAKDAFGKNVSGFAIANIACVERNGTLSVGDMCNYKLKGIHLIEVNSEQQQMGFYIIGNRDSNYTDHVVLTWQLIEVPSAIGYLQVNIRDCYLGYVYDIDYQMCVCYSGNEDAIACNSEDYTACVRFGYWYGLIRNESGIEEFTVTDCSFGSCDYKFNGQCPTERCSSDGTMTQFFCKLPKYDSDELCLFNKGGVVCSECRDNYYPAIEHLLCLPEGNCHLGYVVLIVLLCALYWCLVLTLILLVARFDLRIGSGRLYCLFFYFSVFSNFTGGTFPSKYLYGIELFFTGIVQFNPVVLGLLPMCSGLNSNRFLSVFLRFGYPLLLSVVIVLITYISWKWPRYALFRHTSMGINAICIMLYLCFISITQTSLLLLAPMSFPDIKGVYTFLEPTVEYFRTPQHIFFGLVALCVQVFVIAFIGLLIFSQCLIRYKRLNLTRIKPLLDEFQHCYKTEYRYFAGYYLACRELIFLISFARVPLGIFSYIYILQILSIILLIFHCMIQPYKSKDLNVLDALLILDLVILSLLHGNTAAIVFDDVIWLKITLIYILVLLPVLYFVCLCVYPIFLIRFPRLKRFKITFFKEQEPQKALDVAPPIMVGTTFVHLSSSSSDEDSDEDKDSNGKTNRKFVFPDGVVLVENMEREPLLFLDTLSTDYESKEQRPRSAVNAMLNTAGNHVEEKEVGSTSTIPVEMKDD